MKRLHILAALAFALSLLAPLVSSGTRAAPATDDVPIAAEPAAPTGGAAGGGNVIGPLSKAGVLAAVGCGFAIASMVALPNPVSGFVMGLDCGLMFIDALESPDR